MRNLEEIESSARCGSVRAQADSHVASNQFKQTWRADDEIIHGAVAGAHITGGIKIDFLVTHQYRMSAVQAVIQHPNAVEIFRRTRTKLIDGVFHLVSALA